MMRYPPNISQLIDYHLSINTSVIFSPKFVHSREIRTYHHKSAVDRRSHQLPKFSLFLIPSAFHWSRHFDVGCSLFLIKCHLHFLPFERSSAIMPVVVFTIRFLKLCQKESLLNFLPLSSCARAFHFMLCQSFKKTLLKFQNFV